MKKILLFAFALIAVAPVAVEAQQDMDELVRQGDIWLKRGFIRRNNLTPYTGDVVRYNHDKTEVQIRASMRNGRFHGLYQSFGAFVIQGMNILLELPLTLL